MLKRRAGRWGVGGLEITWMEEREEAISDGGTVSKGSGAEQHGVVSGCKIVGLCKAERNYVVKPGGKGVQTGCGRKRGASEGSAIGGDKNRVQRENSDVNV